jgi:hypothetical protein
MEHQYLVLGGVPDLLSAFSSLISSLNLVPLLSDLNDSTGLYFIDSPSKTLRCQLHYPLLVHCTTRFGMITSCEFSITI